MKTFYPTLKKSCRKLYDNWKALIGIIFVDLLFLLTLGFTYFKVWEKAMVHIDAVLKIMDANLGQLAGEATEEQLAALMANSAEFTSHYQQITKYVGILFVSLLVFWCVFQGFSWLKTHSLLKNKEQDFWKFFSRFSLISVVWWVLFGLVAALSMKLSFYSSVSAVPVFGKTASSLLVYLLMFLLFSMAYTSYILVPKHATRQLLKETLKALYKNYKTLVPVYLFTLIILIAEYYIFMKSMAFGGYAAAVFALVIMLPTIAWSRFYAITALEK